MIALFLLAFVQDAPPVTADETDIVVVAERLGSVRVAVGQDSRGKFTCQLNLSTGRNALNEQLCSTAAACVRQKAPDIQACVNASKPALLAQVRTSMGGAQ